MASTRSCAPLSAVPPATFGDAFYSEPPRTPIEGTGSGRVAICLTGQIRSLPISLLNWERTALLRRLQAGLAGTDWFVVTPNSSSYRLWSRMIASLAPLQTFVYDERISFEGGNHTPWPFLEDGTRLRFNLARLPQFADGKSMTGLTQLYQMHKCARLIEAHEKITQKYARVVRLRTDVVSAPGLIHLGPIATCVAQGPSPICRNMSQQTDGLILDCLQEAMSANWTVHSDFVTVVPRADMAPFFNILDNLIELGPRFRVVRVGSLNNELAREGRLPAVNHNNSGSSHCRLAFDLVRATGEPRPLFMSEAMERRLDSAIRACILRAGAAPMQCFEGAAEALYRLPIDLIGACLGWRYDGDVLISPNKTELSPLSGGACTNCHGTHGPLSSLHRKNMAGRAALGDSPGSYPSRTFVRNSAAPYA